MPVRIDGSFPGDLGMESQKHQSSRKGGGWGISFKGSNAMCCLDNGGLAHPCLEFQVMR